MKELLIVVAIASLSLSWATAAWAESPRCRKAAVYAEGGADVSSKLARESAIAAWRRRVAAQDGESWAVWGYARDARVACDMARRLTGHCSARARPCRDPHIK
jgi:hypothetical protein